MSRTSVRARISEAPTGRISVKFGIVYYENMSKQIQIWVKSKTSRNLYEHISTIHTAERYIMFVNNAQGKHSCASMAKKRYANAAQCYTCNTYMAYTNQSRSGHVGGKKLHQYYDL